jgi:hypothetical protein
MAIMTFLPTDAGRNRTPAANPRALNEKGLQRLEIYASVGTGTRCVELDAPWEEPFATHHYAIPEDLFPCAKTLLPSRLLSSVVLG